MQIIYTTVQIWPPEQPTDQRCISRLAAPSGVAAACAFFFRARRSWQARGASARSGGVRGGAPRLKQWRWPCGAALIPNPNPSPSPSPSPNANPNPNPNPNPSPSQPEPEPEP